MPKYVLRREDTRYKGWYSPGGYPLYPDDIVFNKEGPPVVPTYSITDLYEGCGLPAPPLLEDSSMGESLNENCLFENPFDKQEKSLPRYGRQIWVKPKTRNDIYTGYDEEGLPVFPDGSARPLSVVEIHHLKMTRPQFTNNMPKKPNKSRSYKTRKNKNPPPSKVDLDQLFREENDRIRRRKEYD